jgi:hypothetical protein
MIHRDLELYSPFITAYLLLFLFFVLENGKPYCFSPICPMLLAAGPVLIEQSLARGVRVCFHRTSLALLLVLGLVTLPLFLPLIPVQTYVRIASTPGIGDIKTERQGDTLLPQVIADRSDWREMTQDVASVYASLPAGEKAGADIYTQNYGEAGAPDFFGKRYGLPKAASGHHNYWLWGTLGYSGDMTERNGTAGGYRIFLISLSIGDHI